MAVTAAELEIIYGSMLQAETNKANVFVQLCNRTHEAEVQSNRTKKIPKSDTTAALQAYTHGASWTTTIQDVDISYVDFTPDTAKDDRHKIPYNVGNDLPVDLVVDAAQKQGRAYADDWDDGVYDIMYAGLSAANISDLGATADFIPVTGVPSSTAAAKLVWQALWQIWLRAQATNIARPAGEGGVSDLWAVMPPYLYYSLAEYLRESGNSDAISTAVIRNGAVGRLLGLFDIILSNQDMTESRSSKDHGIILAGTSAATTFAEKPGVVQVLTPQINQDGPYWLLNIMREYGALVENNKFLIARAIRQEA